MCKVEESFLSAIQCYWIKDVRQAEIYTTEPMVPEPCAFEVELAIEKLKDINHQVLIKSLQN
jgi:hypothetical protein